MLLYSEVCYSGRRCVTLCCYSRRCVTLVGCVLPYADVCYSRRRCATLVGGRLLWLELILDSVVSGTNRCAFM